MSCVIPSGHHGLMILQAPIFSWKGKNTYKNKGLGGSKHRSVSHDTRLILLLSPRAEHAGCFSATEPSWHCLFSGCHSKLVPSLLFLQMEDVLVPAPATEGSSGWSLPTVGRCSRSLDFLLRAVSLDHNYFPPPFRLETNPGVQSNLSYVFAFWRETYFGLEVRPLFWGQENSDFSKSSHKRTQGHRDIFSWRWSGTQLGFERAPRAMGLWG